MFCLRRIALRAYSIPSTSFTVSHRPISSLTTPLRLLNQPRTAFWPLQRRFAHDETAQAEPEANGAEEAQRGDDSIFEASHTEAQKHDWVDLSNSTNLSSEAESSTGAFTGGFSGVAGSAAAAAPGSTGENIDSENIEDTAGFSSFNPTIHRTGFTPPSTSVYVGNLYFDVTEGQLETEFRKAGEIEKMNIVRDGRGFSKGIAFIEYVDQQSADRAIEIFRDSIFEGRRLTVQYARSREDSLRYRERPLSPPSMALFIGNMSFDMSDRELNNLFSTVRNVTDVRVAIDRRTGQPRGFAHVDFVDVECATKAMEKLKDMEVKGRKLRLDYSRSTRAKERESKALREEESSNASTSSSRESEFNYSSEEGGL